jgi:hypothetical protein
MVFALRASLSAVQICSRQICRFCRGFSEGASQPRRKTRGIPAAPLRANLDKSCDARAVCKGFNSVPSAICSLRGFLILKSKINYYRNHSLL